MHPSPGPRGKLVVVHPERKAQRTLERMVGASMCPVEVVDSLDGLTARLDEHAIVIVDAGLALTRPGLRDAGGRAWIAVPGEGLAPADPSTIETLLVAGWSHVISQPMPLLAEELLGTIQKLIRRDVFGLEKYVAWGAEVRSYTLEDVRDRDVAVSALARDVVSVGLPDRVSSMVSVIADELLSNALYAAPVDDDGGRPRATEPRDRARALTGRDEVTVRWATDARYLAVEVRDRWGSLDPAMVGARLVAVKQPIAEAGMGLPLVYACCNQLVVGSAPGQMTELIALLDVRFRPTELSKVASFHAFVGDLAITAPSLVFNRAWAR